MHSLSTTTSMGNSGTETSYNLRESPFVLCVLANLSGFRTMQESAGPGVVHFFTFLHVLWATSGTGNIILFLSFFFHKSIPAVGGPRMYGARLVGSGLYHTKVTMTCVASHCDSRNCLKVPSPSWEANPQ